MDELTVSSGPVWVCSQRPECRGRRTARKKNFTSVPATTPTAVVTVKAKPLTTAPTRVEAPEPTARGGRARTICPATA